MAAGTVEGQEAGSSLAGGEGGIQEARFRWGPLGLSPRVALTNLGFDTNVFNDAENPTRDFTTTISPGTTTWLRFGPAQLSVATTLDYNYFQTAADQRSLDLGNTGRFELNFYRVTPFVAGEYVTTRQRPNLEIDARARQQRQRLGAGAVLRLGARTAVDLEASHSIVDFDDEEFGDPLLAEQLNHDSLEGAVTLRRALTPLTTLRVSGRYVQDRFETEGRPDSNSYSVEPGFSLRPLALISGEVMVGYRHFDAIDPIIPDYSGVVAATSVSYILRELTRFAFSVSRDVDYSIDDAQPYSVVTQTGLALTQVIGLDWYVEGRGSIGRLAYRGPELEGLAVDARVDRLVTYGAGVSRRIGAYLRVGVNADQVRRESVIEDHRYEGLRVGGVISYGN